MAEFARPDAEPVSRMPSISVIIPTYNCEATIGEALACIAGQDYPALEVLVIDDGSTDATVSIAKRACPGAIIHRQSNAGAAAARNRGLREATGELVAFLDADDCWFPGKLRAQAAALTRHGDAGLCFTAWLVAAVAPSLTELESMSKRDGWPDGGTVDAALSGWLYPSLLLDVVIHTSTLVLRRQLARDTGYFDESLRRGQDYDYWLRMSRLSTGVKLARPFALYRRHPGNSTIKPQPRNYGFEIVTRALRQWGSQGPDGQGPDAAQIRATLSRLCRDFAYLHASRGNPVIALKEAARAIGSDPLDARNLWLSLKTGGRAAARWLAGRA